MILDNVFISEFDENTAITYPEQETKGSINRQPCDLTDQDYNFNHGVHKVPGFRIHHIETLQPVIYYIRFLVDREFGQVQGGAQRIKRYVVTARVNLNNFGHSDMLELIKKAVDKIKVS